MIAGDGSLLHLSTPSWLAVMGRLRRHVSTAGVAPRLTEILRQWIRHDAGYPGNWIPDIIRDLPRQTVAVVPAGPRSGRSQGARWWRPSSRRLVLPLSGR